MAKDPGPGGLVLNFSRVWRRVVVCVPTPARPVLARKEEKRAASHRVSFPWEPKICFVPSRIRQDPPSLRLATYIH